MERGYSMPAHRSTARARLVVVASVAFATFSLLAIRSAGRSSWTLSSLLRPLQDGSEDSSAAPLLAVHAVAYGASRFPENYVFVDGDPDVSLRFGWLCYALRYGQEPWILVDTGFNDLPLASAFALTEHIDPLALLEARLGVRPAEVGTLVVTHHHFDHAGNVARFPNAVVHMHAEVAEVLHLPENAWDCPGALDSPERRDCGPNHPKGTERLRSNGSVPWEAGHHARSLPERLAAAGLLRTFEGRWSDPIPLGSAGHYLRVERVGGHAPGSCMVWLHAPPPSSASSSAFSAASASAASSASASASLGPPPALALLAGDEIYHPENLRQRRPTGVSVNASVSAAVLDYIRAAQAAGTLVFTYHDPDVVAGTAGTDGSGTAGRSGGSQLGTRRVCCAS